YTEWRNGLGSMYTMADYTIWKSNFGESAWGGSGSASAATVPEPSTAAIIGIGVIAALCGRRLRQRSRHTPCAVTELEKTPH
ncbi:MAG: PEP-CTERM sorting domain-containing protein, partial [Pirellulales bacterium]